MRRLVGAGAVALLAGGLALGGAAASASAHILPTTTVVLAVRSDHVDAALRIPLADLESASGIDLGATPAAHLALHAAELRTYLLSHFQPSSADGDWAVSVGALRVTTTSQFGTGAFPVLTTTARLTPPSPADERSFELGYDAVIHQVITHTVLVSVGSDWQTGRFAGAYDVGTIHVDTVTGTVPPLRVSLGSGSAWQGFTGMVGLGMAHILQGTDHQLFLLTLLLPAPLLAVGRRWAGPVRPRTAVRKIATITLAFTIGHSVTLALGALGLPVPQQLVETLIAVSILVAAAHAIRPLFPGREAVIAAGFGLVHGLAFSATLSELDLSGGQLALSLLGFNLGIELMQLIVVALVLPPLIVLARTAAYRPIRIGAAAFTGLAAAGWVIARIGMPNPIATAADGLVAASPLVVGVLWAAAAVGVVVLLRRRAAAESSYA